MLTINIINDMYFYRSKNHPALSRIWCKCLICITRKQAKCRPEESTTILYSVKIQETRWNRLVSDKIWCFFSRLSDIISPMDTALGTGGRYSFVLSDIRRIVLWYPWLSVALKLNYYTSFNTENINHFFANFELRTCSLRQTFHPGTLL